MLASADFGSCGFPLRRRLVSSFPTFRVIVPSKASLLELDELSKRR